MSTIIPDTVYIWRRFTETNLVIEIRLLKVERELPTPGVEPGPQR